MPAVRKRLASARIVVALLLGVQHVMRTPWILGDAILLRRRLMQPPYCHMTSKTWTASSKPLGRTLPCLRKTKPLPIARS
jgi:hypothetical protein